MHKDSIPVKPPITPKGHRSAFHKQNCAIFSKAGDLSSERAAILNPNQIGNAKDKVISRLIERQEQINYEGIRKRKSFNSAVDDILAVIFDK